ncbi:hypothetical protein B0H14DRAFT_3851256 [Mycena olivaceomarginata]|nr:hypothetical protein B0H14DRAFT_3851256 [Mycena olivaceomarginata]
MPALPAELWLYIASFIPDDEILQSRLIGVNLVFYNLVLELRSQRYNTIRVETVNTTTEALLRQLRNPAVASHVRSLIVCPSAGFQSKAAAPSLWQKITSGYGYYAKARLTVEAIVDALVLVFPGLTGLTRFDVDLLDVSPEYDLQRFFRSAWAAFGAQLERIYVAGRPEMFRRFVASDSRLVSCTTLMLRFTDELDYDVSELQTLTLWSWSTLDLSGLVRALGHFPRLSTFNLRAPFNKAFSDPSGAERAARNPRRHAGRLAMDPASEQVLAAWLLSHAARPRVLAGLELLRITLTTLAVKDRYFDLDEVAALLAPVAHRAPGEGLVALRLNVRVWNTALFDLLAGTLPGLKSLTLYVSGAHPDRAAREQFFAEMHARSFASWRLNDIGVWQGGSEVPPGTMRRLAECIPSVRSFWENGHMLGDKKIYD